MMIIRNEKRGFWFENENHMPWKRNWNEKDNGHAMGFYLVCFLSRLHTLNYLANMAGCCICSRRIAQLIPIRNSKVHSCPTWTKKRKWSIDIILLSIRLCPMHIKHVYKRSLLCTVFYPLESLYIIMQGHNIIKIKLPFWLERMILKCTFTHFFFDMWKGHILEVHCTNIQRKRFIK